MKNNFIKILLVIASVCSNKGFSAQHDYSIANQTGSSFRSDLNNALSAIVSQNSGSSEPSTTFAYQWWADTTTGLLKIRNAANNSWISIGTLSDANLGLLSLEGGTLTGQLLSFAGTVGAPGIAFSGDADTGLYRVSANTWGLVSNGVEYLRVSTSGITFLGTGAATLPVGTTAQRPTPSNGMIRANTDTNAIEGYINSSWQSLNGVAPQTYRSVTTTDSATTNDDILAFSGASFVETLPTAVGNTGKEFTLLHDGTSLTQVYTLNTTSGQTIGGIASGVYKLYTNGEKLVIFSDGSNWKIRNHYAKTAQADAGALVFSSASHYVFTIPSSSISVGTIYTSNGNTFYVSATTSSSTTLNCYGTGSPGASGTLTFVSGTSGNKTFSSVSTASGPTKGSTTYEKFLWSRDGADVIFRYDVSLGAGTAGTGDYGIMLPANLPPDTTNMQLSTGTVGAVTQSIVHSQIGTGFLGSSVNNTVEAFMGNTGFFKVVIPGNGLWNGGVAGSIGNAFSLSILGRYPVLGWQP